MPTVLIHPHGAINHEAIACTVKRLIEACRNYLIAEGYDGKDLYDLVMQNCEIYERRIYDEAIKQRDPFVQRALSRRETEEELADAAELDRLIEAKNWCAISGQGNREFDAINLQIDIIHRRQRERAIKYVEGTAP
jgi:hypothetical protein